MAPWGMMKAVHAHDTATQHGDFKRRYQDHARWHANEREDYRQRQKEIGERLGQLQHEQVHSRGVVMPWSRWMRGTREQQIDKLVKERRALGAQDMYSKRIQPELEDRYRFHSAQEQMARLGPLEGWQKRLHDPNREPHEKAEAQKNVETLQVAHNVMAYLHQTRFKPPSQEPPFALRPQDRTGINQY